MANNLTDEKKTIRYMIEIYCRGEHKASSLYNECVNLLKYAMTHLDKYPFDKSKVTCNKCKIHCYEEKLRKEIRKVMKHSGPWMLYRHPITAIRHMKKGFRK
jgi:hypothetical protein